jgi:hypothetical protein
MFKKASSNIKAIMYLFLMLNVCTCANAQNNIAINAGILYGYSMLTFNQKSELFDKRIADENYSYKPISNIGVVLGATVFITNRLSLQLINRLQQWGGVINVQSKQNTSNMLKLEINYLGYRLPAYLQYMIWGNKNMKINTSIGVGIEYTYRLWFIPSTFYGSAPVQRRNVYISVPFASSGISFCYTKAPEDKFNYILGIFYETDAFFNPRRSNEFNFWQNSVPLLSHQLFPTLIMQYRL